MQRLPLSRGRESVASDLGEDDCRPWSSGDGGEDVLVALLPGGGDCLSGITNSMEVMVKGATLSLTPPFLLPSAPSSVISQIHLCP
jgi:hypothetical protein